jgi:DNA-binding transcriptional MerR regulator
MEANLRIGDVAKLANCCRNTVLNYEKKGLIASCRTIYGHRRFTLSEAERLRRILKARWPNE